MEDSRTAFKEEESPGLPDVIKGGVERGIHCGSQQSSPVSALRKAIQPNELAGLEEDERGTDLGGRFTVCDAHIASAVIIFPLDDDVGSGLLSEEALQARVVKRHGEGGGE